jgi:hypothetical protein
MKAYVHARLSAADRAMLDQLREATGHSESELLRRGLHLVARTERRRRSALSLAGRSAGKFKKGPPDLSTNAEHLDDFGR